MFLGEMGWNLMNIWYDFSHNFLSGKLVEYDEPMKLMQRERSLFAELVKEYWSNTTNSSVHPTI